MRETPVPEVGTVAIPVTDQERAVEFYIGTLGFEKRRDFPFAGARWIEVAPPGAATTIALVPPTVPVGIRLFVADADAIHAQLRARGVDTDPAVMRMDGAPPMFALRDPDGNDLFVVEGA